MPCGSCHLVYQIKVIDQLWVNLQELRPLGSINRSLWWILIGLSGAHLPTSPYVGPHPQRTLWRLCSQEDGSNFGFAGP